MISPKILSLNISKILKNSLMVYKWFLVKMNGSKYVIDPLGTFERAIALKNTFNTRAKRFLPKSAINWKKA